MTFRYKNFGVVKACNYRSKTKYIITNKNGSSLCGASTIKEVKKIINKLIEDGAHNGIIKRIKQN